MKHKAVFFDRDGTLIVDHGYIGDPADVELLPGAAGAVQQLRDAGYLAVLVSNQSGIARGLFDEDALHLVHERLQDLLIAEGTELDGSYYCPYLDGPEAVEKKYRRDSELRKPKPGMLLQAARELNIDLRESWMIGDSPQDVEAGHRAGCRTVLLRNNDKPPAESATRATHTVDSIEAAVYKILGPAAIGRRRAATKPPARSMAVVPQPVSVAEPAPAVSPPPPAPQTPPDSPEAGDLMRMLTRIHDLVDRSLRDRRQDDFSVLRLFGALLQMFAILALLWGAYALFSESYDGATARLSLACFLQLAAISAFAVDRFR